MLEHSGFTRNMLNFALGAEHHVQGDGRPFTDESPGATSEPHQQVTCHVCVWPHSLRKFYVCLHSTPSFFFFIFFD